MSRAVSCALSDIDMAEPAVAQRSLAVLSDTRESRSLPAVVRLPRRMPLRQAAPAVSEWALYEKTVLPHVARLRSRAWRLTRSPERTDGLVQETCLKALKAFHRFRPGSNARAWLDRILKKTFINEWRSRGGRSPRTVFMSIDDAPDGPAPGIAVMVSGPHESFSLHRGACAVDAIFENIPPHYRSALRLLYEGFSYKEIARSLDLPMGTVMSRLYRARRCAARLLAASSHVARTFPPAHCSVTQGDDTRAPAP